MNSLKLFNDCLSFKQVPRIPTDLHNFMICWKHSNMTFDEFVLDADAMAKAHISQHSLYNHDVLLVENGTASLAQALGCVVTFRKDEPPTVTGSAISSLDELDNLVIDESILNSPLIKANIETVKILKAHFGDSAVVMGRGDQGPFSLASQVIGMSELLMSLMDEDEVQKVHKLLTLCVKACTIYCKALIKAGADCTSMGDSTAGPDVISPEMYKTFASKYEKQLVQNVHKVGGRIALHICGNATNILDDMMATEADIIEIDQKTDFAVACAKAKKKAVLLGQISPTNLVCGTVEDIIKECEQTMDVLKSKTATGMIFGPGCAMGSDTPHENIKAMLSCVK